MKREEYVITYTNGTKETKMLNHAERSLLIKSVERKVKTILPVGYRNHFRQKERKYA